MEVYTQLYANCDKTLNVLAANPHHRMMESDIYGHADAQERPGMRAALMHLCQYGQIKADPHPYYLLLGPGSTLQATGGYKAQFEEENRLEEEGGKIAALTLKNAQSVIDTNSSIQKLNDNTIIFYDKQTGFNRWQKGLTIAIGLFTLAQVLIAIFKKDSKAEIIQMPSLKEVESKLNQLTEETRAKANQDSLFHQQVRDSLKMK